MEGPSSPPGKTSQFGEMGSGRQRSSVFVVCIPGHNSLHSYYETGHSHEHELGEVSEAILADS